MAAPYNNVRSKLNRAICAYLVTQNGCGTAADVLPENIAVVSNYPNTTVRATRGIPFPNNTGTYRITTHIIIKGSAVPPNTRLAFDARLAYTADALMMTDNNQNLFYTAAQITAAGRALAASDPANNADMVDFTCQEWYDMGFGDGEPDEEGTSWVEILIFDAVACGSNCD